MKMRKKSTEGGERLSDLGGVSHRQISSLGSSALLRTQYVLRCCIKAVGILLVSIWLFVFDSASLGVLSVLWPKLNNKKQPLPASCLPGKHISFPRVSSKEASLPANVNFGVPTL